MDALNYKNLADNCLKRIGELQNYAYNASVVIDKFKKIKDELLSCMKYYENGGYIDEGVTLDRGVLLEEVNNINIFCSNLQETIELSSVEISNYKNYYDSYMARYNEIINSLSQNRKSE